MASTTKIKRDYGESIKVAKSTRRTLKKNSSKMGLSIDLYIQFLLYKNKKITKLS